MKKLLFVLLVCSICSLIVPVVSAEESCRLTLHAQPLIVYKGHTVVFSGQINPNLMYGGHFSDIQIQLYQSKSTSSPKTLIGTTRAKVDGTYSFTYRPSQTLYYQTKCIPIFSRFSIAPFSQSVKVMVIPPLHH
jgi:hypothetical protein